MTTARTTTRIWDLPIRLFHWLVVGLVIFQFTTIELGETDLHIAGGCTMLALLLFRLVWGIAGSETARFGAFLRSPAAAFRHLAAFRTDRATTPGHTASGGWAVLAMLLALAAQVGTGLFADDDIASQGPLGQFVSKTTRRQLTGLHARLFWVLVGLIALHVSAIAAYRLIRRENLLAPMITGRGPLPPGQAAPRLAPLWLAAMTLSVAAFAAWRIWALGDG